MIGGISGDEGGWKGTKVSELERGGFGQKEGCQKLIFCWWCIY